jgi:hypothetical protein
MGKTIYTIIFSLSLFSYTLKSHADMQATYDKVTGNIITVGNGVKPESNQEITTVPDYVADNPRDYKITSNGLSDATKGTLFGMKIHAKSDVYIAMNKKIDSIFGDPDNILTSAQYKEKLISRFICVSLADNGHISYELIGIPGVFNKSTASDYVLKILPLWLEAQQVSIEADKFITDNNL